MFKNIFKKIKEIPVKKLVLFTILFFLSLIIVLSYTRKSAIKAYVNTNDFTNNYVETNNMISGNLSYTNKLIEYQNNNYKFINQDIELDNELYNGNQVLNNDLDYGDIVSNYIDDYGGSKVFLLDYQNSLKITINEIESGVHYLAVDYYELSNSIDNNQISILINGEVPFHESNTLVLSSYWQFESEEFKLDRYENEIQPGTIKDIKWRNQALYDYYGQHPGYYGFYLNEGDVIEIKSVNNELLIGSVYLKSYQEISDYQTYLNKYSHAELIDSKIEIAARNMADRSEPSIRLRSELNPSNLYYDSQRQILNTIFSESWQNGGQAVTYNVSVEESGFYNLAFKYRQNLISEMPVFRQIKINGEVPFDLFESYAFPYTQGFINRIVTDQDGNNINVYLEAGDNTITLTAVNYPYRTAIEKIREIMSEIQSLALSVKRYTSNSNDNLRDWDIEENFPTAKDSMLEWALELEELHGELKQLSGSNNPSQIANLTQAAKRLKSIGNDINKLPSKMMQFSDGDSSVNTLLGDTMQRLMISGLELERTVFYGHQKVSKPYSNIFKATFEEIKRLVLSYVNNPYSAASKSDEDLNVWVNYPRQYIEVLQLLIDDQYDGNRRVTLSQMPDQNRLILANASGDAPDVTLGVDHWIPYDFAIRDAALDLRQFEGYEEVVANLAKGAIMPYIFEDGVFGLPETQNFWVTYYRKDILESIGVNEIPQTWDEVKALLPVLQSYDLNYFVPLSQYVGLKPFVATLPFIYQFGGHLYTEDGMSTGIASTETLEGMRLMSELFTLYNMPEYVASFYNHFRYGMLPIGISDLSTYILLTTTALELDGLWEIDLHPGNYNEENDEIVRFAPAGAQSAMIMSSTNYQDDAWDFLKWWLSTDVQSEFAFVLQNTYGKTYFWNTANLNAFETLSIPRKHKDVILGQWEYASEAPRIPGSYMVEREISNAWTRMVFDGANPRLALDEAVRISNREILYKMAEFGYVENGVPVKNYHVPTMDNIEYWLKGANNND